MDRFKKHIISFLALLFLVVQGMQSIHFYLFHFEINSIYEAKNGLSFSTEDVNHCEFIFFKTSLSFKNTDFSDKKPFYKSIQKRFLFVKKIHINKFEQTNFLRGPPGTYV